MAFDTCRRAELGAFSLPSRHGETLSRVDPRGTAADAETASATHQFKLPEHRKWVSDSPPRAMGEEWDVGWGYVVWGEGVTFKVNA